jgi:hypothetical protein
MPTQGEIDDVLAKAATVRTTKVAYDAAVLDQNDAIQNANNARNAWGSAVNSGADAPTLEALLGILVATEVVRAAKAAALEASQTPYGEAQSALQTATDAIIAEALNP